MADDDKQGSMQVKFHPEFWADLEKMSPEDREQMQKIMAVFKQAAAATPKGSPPEVFEEHVRRLMAEAGLDAEGGPVEEADLTEEEKRVVAERMNNGTIN